MLRSKKIKVSLKSKELEDLVTKPEKMVYLVGVLCVSVLSCLLVIEQESAVSNNIALPIVRQSIPMVKGESIKSQLAVQQGLNLAYEESLKFILEDYLTIRIDSQNIKSKLVANLKAQENILNLSVPEQYQKLHLELMVILNQEVEILKQNKLSGQPMEAVDLRLKEILESHNFLN